MPEKPQHKYRRTLRLPNTDFPMKAGLPDLEKRLLARWRALDLYNRRRKNAREREPFILHDGPPYANGPVHLGTALNKILKDMINRSQYMMEKNAVYIPGWDCHGLPIEWQVEERYRGEGKNKDEIPRAQLRQDCRAFAEKWISVQKEQFQRLGVEGDWEKPYLTMSRSAEARIVEECLRFAMRGSLYRGLKPVMWSVVEETALAEAEVEYHERVSETIFVRFPLAQAPDEIGDASILIWTTTPWTIPGNRAIAFAPHLSYGLYETVKGGTKGERVIVADNLSAHVAESAGVTFKRVGGVDFKDHSRWAARHPFYEEGYDFPVPLLPADHVTDEAGTGFVHTAPSHGREDFELGAKHGLEVPDLLDHEGVFRADVPLFAGARVLDAKGSEGDANKRIIKALAQKDALFARGELRHDYPHSWRSKAPVIFRATPQWFISMEKHELRETALRAIGDVAWHPKQGEKRLASMVASRPDWVVSRQRSWGVPLTLFLHKESETLLRDERVNARIISAVRERGADAWFDMSASEFLGEDYDADEWERVEDILDVWFESGATQSFVLEDNPDLRWPASLYLEGSDQHRGWFQSSLLLACGSRGRAPYEAVLTHGFVLDGEGKKMSKSLGNSIDPMEIAERKGAELLRLWVAASDTTEDMRMSDDIMKSTEDSYRKIRNALRFLLGNLDFFAYEERTEYKDLPELERFILHEVAMRDPLIREAYANFNFKYAVQEILFFITRYLSSFYFDIRKDSLYCDPHSSRRRRSCRSTLHMIFYFLTGWLAPILVFTTEEAWISRYPGYDDDSIHLRTFPEVPEEWRDEALAKKWRRILEIRQVITAALEIERKAGRIGSSLDAAPDIYLEDEKDIALLADLDIAEIAITSQARLHGGEGGDKAFRLSEVSGVSVETRRAEGARCARSWKILPDVGSDPDYPDLSARDAAAVKEWERS